MVWVRTSGSIIGIALEAFDGTDALSEGVVSQLLDNETPKLEAASISTEEETKDLCYFGGGNRIGRESKCKAVETSPFGKTSDVFPSTSDVEEKGKVSPAGDVENGPAEEAQIFSAEIVKIGKILVFVNLGYRKLDSEIVNEDSGLWLLDQATGKVTASYTLDMNEKDIINVRNILSSSGNWTIEEDGTLTARRVIADEVDSDIIKTRDIVVGTQDHPSGITVYDLATKEPVCIYVENEVMISKKGECISIVPASSDVEIIQDGNVTTIIEPNRTVIIATSSTQVSTSTTVETTYIHEIETVVETIDTEPNAVSDSEPPKITIIGNNPAKIELRSSYSDMGVTVTDNVNYNLGYSVSINEVDMDQIYIDTREPGTHTILYIATDQAGNTGVAERIVNVVDTADNNSDSSADTTLIVDESAVYDEIASTTEATLISTTTPII